MHFQLTPECRASLGKLFTISVTYLMDSDVGSSSWVKPQRDTSQDRRADRHRMLDIRGMD
jgi:hypothetical protein